MRWFSRVRAAFNSYRSPPEIVTGRHVWLRSETDGLDSRKLFVYLDHEGLQIRGHDIGPQTAIVSSTGEYEWFQTVRVADLPKLIGLLGADPGDDILDVLEENWTGPRAGDFEILLSESDIEVPLSIWPFGPHTRP